MKLADFFSGLVSAAPKEAAVVLTDVVKVFDTAKAAIAASPLPANLKTDLTDLVQDSHDDVVAAAGLAGGLFGEAVAAGVGDVTTLFYNTANAVAGAKSLTDLTNAEKTILAQSWKTIVAQGNTLLAQAMAGIDPVAAQAAKAVPQS